MLRPAETPKSVGLTDGRLIGNDFPVALGDINKIFAVSDRFFRILLVRQTKVVFQSLINNLKAENFTISL